MDSPISRAEHEAFAELMNSENRRLEEENDRQNKRIASLEANARQITDLAVSVRELAVNMLNMTTEIARQNDRAEQQAKRIGERLEKLESRDGEMWRKIVTHAITVILGLAVGYVASRIGLN